MSSTGAEEGCVDRKKKELSEQAITGRMRAPSTTDSGCVAMSADNIWRFEVARGGLRPRSPRSQ